MVAVSVRREVQRQELVRDLWHAVRPFGRLRPPEVLPAEEFALLVLWRLPVQSLMG